METAKVYFYIYTTHLELINLSKNELSNWIVICLSSSSSSWTTLRTKHKKRDYSRGKYTYIHFHFALIDDIITKGSRGILSQSYITETTSSPFFVSFVDLINLNLLNLHLWWWKSWKDTWDTVVGIIPNRSRGLSTIWWCMMIPKSGERKGRIGQ